MTVTIHRLGGHVLPVLHGECTCGQEVSCTAYSDCEVIENGHLPAKDRVYILTCTNCESTIHMEHLKNKEEYISRLEILQMLDDTSAALENILLHAHKADPCVIASVDWRARTAKCSAARNVCDKLLRGDS